MNQRELTRLLIGILVLGVLSLGVNAIADVVRAGSTGPIEARIKRALPRRI